VADGSFEFTGLEPGEVEISAAIAPTDKVSASAEPRRISKTAIIKNGQTTTVDFDFPAADATLEGAISLCGASPKHAHVSLTVTTAKGDRERFELSVRPGNGAASYCFEHLPAGAASLWATASSEDGERRSGQYDLTLSEGLRHSLDIDFTGRAAVEGVVSGIASSEACTVCLYSDLLSPADRLERMLGRMESLIAKADASTAVRGNGVFRMEGVEPGMYSAVVYATDAQANPVDRVPIRHGGTLVSLTEGEVTNLQLTLE